MTQKSNKVNSVVILDKDFYIKRIESLLSNKAQFEKVGTKKGLLNFTANHKKWNNVYLKYLKSSGALSEQHNKIIGAKPGKLYGLCKVNKNIEDGCPPFRPVFSAIGTPLYKFCEVFGSQNEFYYI